MYVLDPDKGKRRRAIARDKARSLMLDTRDAIGVTRRDVAHRVQGLRARARRLVSQQHIHTPTSPAYGYATWEP